MKQLLSFLLAVLITFALLPLSAQYADQAREHLENAIELIGQEHYEEALEYVGKAIEIQQQNAQLYRLQAQILEMLDRTEDASAAWQNCLNFAQEDTLRKEAEHHLRALRE